MTTIPTTVILRRGREETARRHHPWVFSGAVERVKGDPAPGAVVRVEDAEGAFVAHGHWSPRSQISVRILDWNPEATIDAAWWRRRLTEAVERRPAYLADPASTVCRLVHAESDFLPGLIIDAYGPYLVLQALSVGMDRVKGELAAVLHEITGAHGVLERSEAEVRRLEGLPPEAGVLAGTEPPGRLELREGAVRLLADLREGQKTGFYIDQGRNRELVGSWSAGRRVLDCFCYTGAFATHAGFHGAAALTLIESSAPALALAAENLAANVPAEVPRELVTGDAFVELRRFRDERRSFDLVVLDPPRFAPTRALAPKAARAYKDINLLGMKLLAPGGILATFSCSGGIDAAFFREIVGWAAHDAGREVQVLERPGQGPDHPVRLSFPESEYLKGLLCRVL